MVAHHPVIIRGLGQPSKVPDSVLHPPLVVSRTEENFIASVLDDLAHEEGIKALEGANVLGSDTGSVEKLYQPVHRTFNVAILQVACDTYGQPRLDPASIISAGLVVRRVAQDDQGNHLDNLEGWRTSDSSTRGWISFRSDSEPDAQDMDPDPAFRQIKRVTGNAQLDQQFSDQNRLASPLSENFTTLFMAPPDICQAAKRTILYGLVPVTSDEFSRTPESPRPIDQDIVASHLHRFLKASSRRRRFRRSFPFAGQLMTAEKFAEAGKTSPPPDAEAYNHGSPYNDFYLLLSQLRTELDAFSNPDTNPLFQTLNTIILPIVKQNPVGRQTINQILGVRAGDFLRQAASILLENKPIEEPLLMAHPDIPNSIRTWSKYPIQQTSKELTSEVLMPTAWPSLNATIAQQLMSAIQIQLRERFKSLVGKTGRYAGLNRQYRIRAFVRVRSDHGCPPRTHWSDLSDPFTIAAWYESNPDDQAPPVHIPLPNAFDSDFLEKVKPNVSFDVPDELSGFLNQNSPEDLIGGKGKKPKLGFELGWICSFSIPIITLCAFIVLNIFLSLFAMIFFWLPWVKICIPYPKPKVE